MKEKGNNNNFAYIALVAIVAIVGIVILLSSSGASTKTVYTTSPAASYAEPAMSNSEAMVIEEQYQASGEADVTEEEANMAGESYWMYMAYKRLNWCLDYKCGGSAEASFNCHNMCIRYAKAMSEGNVV